MVVYSCNTAPAVPASAPLSKVETVVVDDALQERVESAVWFQKLPHVAHDDGLWMVLPKGW